MRLFAYISLNDLEKILSGKFEEMGVSIVANDDRVCSQNCKPDTKYIELFENLSDVEFMQQFCADKPAFFEGGVVVKVSIPKRVVESREGSTILKVKEGDDEQYLKLKTYVVESKKFRQDNFEDAVFDRYCASSVDELRDEMNFMYSQRAMGE